MAQEQEHHQHDQADADGHGELNIVDRGANHLGPVSHNLQLHRRRQIALQFRQRRFDELDSLVDVEPLQLVNVDDHDALAAEPRCFPDVLDAIHRLAYIADPNRRPIAICDNDRVECRSIKDLIGRIQGQRLPRPVQRAFW